MRISDTAAEGGGFDAAYGSAHEGMDTKENFVGSSLVVADSAAVVRGFDAVEGSTYVSQYGGAYAGKDSGAKRPSSHKATPFWEGAKLHSHIRKPAFHVWAESSFDLGSMVPRKPALAARVSHGLAGAESAM